MKTRFSVKHSRIWKMVSERGFCCVYVNSGTSEDSREWEGRQSCKDSSEVEQWWTWGASCWKKANKCCQQKRGSQEDVSIYSTEGQHKILWQGISHNNLNKELYIVGKHPIIEVEGRWWWLDWENWEWWRRCKEHCGICRKFEWEERGF